MLEEIGAKLVAEGEAQFLAAMDRSNKAVRGFGTETQNAQAPTKGLNSIVTGLSMAMGQALLNAALQAGQAIVGFAKDSITAGSDLSETMNKVTVVFGDQADTLIEFGKNAAISMGMSSNEALSAAGTYGNLFRSMGLTTEASADMSMGVVQLAADLGSFNNLPTADVLEKLRAGLTGEAEPLKSLGININETVIKAKAMEMGLLKGEVSTLDLADAQLKLNETMKASKKAIARYGEGSLEAQRAIIDQAKAEEKLGKVMEGVSSGPLTAAQKAQAAYALMVEQSFLAEGDFMETSGGLANSTKVLTAQFENMKAELGTALLPAVSLVTSALNSLFASPEFQQGMKNFTAWIATAVAWVQEKWPIVMEIFDQVWAAILGGVDWVIGIVQPFLTTMALWWTNNSSEISSTVGTLWASLQAIWSKIVEVISYLVATIGSLIQTVLANITAWWAEHGDQVIALVMAIWNAVVPLFMAAADLIMAIVGVLVKVIGDWWNQHGAQVMDIVLGMWTFVVGIFTVLSAVVTNIFKAFTALLKGDTDAFSTYMKAAWDALWSAIKSAAETAWAALSEWFQGVVDQIVGFFKSPDWASIGKGIVDGIWAGIESGWAWLVNQIDTLVSRLLQAAKDALGITSPSKAFEGVGVNMMLGMGKGIKEASGVPASASALASQRALAPSAMMSAGPTSYNYSTSNAYNLTVMSSQSPQVVQESYAMMRLLRG